MKRLIAIGVGAASAAFAQGAFPSRQVAMIVGFAPGGGTDTAARRR